MSSGRPLPGSFGVARSRRLVPVLLGAVLGLAGLTAACGDSSSPVDLGPGWLVSCATSGECSRGECVCGVCTDACDAAADACGRAASGAACFSAGSFAHAATCGGTGGASDVDGLCLPSCAEGDDCGAGFTCASGACVPAASLPEGAPGDAVSRAYAEAFPRSWLAVMLPGPSASERACDDPSRCPTLEALLRSDDVCHEVWRGCGLTYVEPQAQVAGATLQLWYDAFGAPPVLSFDSISGEFLGSADITCDAIEMACSTCGVPDDPSPTALAGVDCRRVPGIWPASLAPGEEPGCRCEPEGDGARVSLDCFCDLYGCPAQVEFVAGCAPTEEGTPRLDGAILDADGQLWLSMGRFAVQRYAFDPSGALVGAIALGQGPATLPCNTAWVAAGPARAAEPQRTCSCADSIDGAQCGAEPWSRWPL